jgi:hypothetical protein
MSESISVGLKLPKAEAEQMRKLAESSERSFSAEVRLAIRAHLEAKSA